MLRAQHYSPQYTHAVGTTMPYRGTDHTVAVMVQLAKRAVDPREMVAKALGPQGERSISVRRHTEQIINNVRPKDYTSEIIAIKNWWGNAMRYTRDPLHVEMLRTPERLIADAGVGGLCGDCDEYSLAIGSACLTIGARAQFVTVGFDVPMWGMAPVFTHVFCRAQDPRSKVWWVLDPVAGRRTAQMLSRVKVSKVFEVDG